MVASSNNSNYHCYLQILLKNGTQTSWQNEVYRKLLIYGISECFQLLHRPFPVLGKPFPS